MGVLAIGELLLLGQREVPVRANQDQLERVHPRHTFEALVEDRVELDADARGQVVPSNKVQVRGVGDDAVQIEDERARAGGFRHGEGASGVRESWAAENDARGWLAVS